MARVMIECPETGNPVFTGLNLSVGVFEGLPLVGDVFRGCPECGGRHAWAKEDAYLEDD